MAIKEILLMGDKRLREESLPVEVSEIKSKKIQDDIQDLLDTSKLNPQDEAFITVGLSAPQMGLPLRIFVVIDDLDDKRNQKFMVYINPEMDVETTHMISGNESCLSTPGICGMVSRYDSIKLTYYDKDGKKHKERINGEKATFIQHEVDHLNGILWIDRVSDTKTISYC